MARRLNPKPFGLGFKSPRKQFGNLFGEVHCSGDTVAHLTFTVARWLRWPALTRRYIEEKLPISRQNRRYIAINRRFLEIYPEKSTGRYFCYPSTHDISAIYRRNIATFSSLIPIDPLGVRHPIEQCRMFTLSFLNLFRCRYSSWWSTDGTRRAWGCPKRFWGNFSFNRFLNFVIIYKLHLELNLLYCGHSF